MVPDVSIIIPVLDKLEFTKLCLDRIQRNTGDAVSYEVIVIDNASSDGTEAWFADSTRFQTPVQYHRNATNVGFGNANNAGARLSRARHLLFLNNDTLVQPGWLAEMLRVMNSDASVGIVGIKQLFPYTSTIYHTGIVFTPEGRPEHLYPHLDARLPHVNKEREYQAVMGACLLVERKLFEDCGGFDDAYLNGYEDVDLCLSVRQRGRKVVCCTNAFIYHYGQISEGRTAADDRNAVVFANKWAGRVRPDRDEYLIRDRIDSSGPSSSSVVEPRRLAEDCVYFADDLEQGSALTWINAELVMALQKRSVPVFVNGKAPISGTLPAPTRKLVAAAGLRETPVGGVQVKWSHYWPRHMNLELAGDLNLEFFVINYLFAAPGAEPWDYWLQCLRQNHHAKLPLSEFCRDALLQIGVAEHDCHVWCPGYSREIEEVERPVRKSQRFQFLTVTNSHDLERYNTQAIIRAYRNAFAPDDDVVLVIKDYGATSGDDTLRRLLADRPAGAPIEYVSEFSDKRALISLYKSSDAFVSAHRGEGFGMKILDALACGLPVITPLFGGPTAYCTSDNCFPIAFSIVPMGDCLDTRSLRITNSPVWAEVEPMDLARQLRTVYDNRGAGVAVGALARSSVVERFSWDSAATRFLDITKTLREQRPRVSRQVTAPQPAAVHSSPYWLGVRVSVVIPTHNRKEKLLACLGALTRQSVLPQEFEVIVVDDGSSDGTKEALDARAFPFVLRYFRQENAGPGTARNLGVDKAAGELVLFIGDDILADERLLEEHLLAHAASSDPGLAILGRIDWPDSMVPNQVMQYVCGDAALQFAYTLIPRLPSLDHRFFYTSNISLKRRFLNDAADAGVRFDPCFRRAAFEDSEFAFRLIPRGLQIRYAENARVTHDHWMDLESFASREFGAGEMAVVFYRKHPGQDDQLQVRWIADLIDPAAALLAQPELLQHLEAFDAQTDALLRALAGSLEELLLIGQQPGSSTPVNLSADRLRSALHNVLRVIFDVQRTRGKLQEWFLTVGDPAKVRAAQTLAVVTRKTEFLNMDATQLGTLGTLTNVVAPFGRQVIAGVNGGSSVGGRARRSVRRVVANPRILSRLLSLDRFIEAKLQSSTAPGWVTKYRRVRSRIRRLVK